MSMPQLLGGALVVIGIVVLQRPVKKKDVSLEENSISE